MHVFCIPKRKCLEVTVAQCESMLKELIFFFARKPEAKSTRVRLLTAFKALSWRGGNGGLFGTDSRALTEFNAL